jgi:large subunit ribosomal protein L29
MAHIKAQSMRDMSVDELQARVAELREELFNLRFRNSLKQLDNPLKIRESRREMARVLTVLNERLGTQAPAAPKAGSKT